MNMASVIVVVLNNSATVSAICEMNWSAQNYQGLKSPGGV